MVVYGASRDRKGAHGQGGLRDKSRNPANQLGNCENCVLGRTHECPNRAKTPQEVIPNVCSVWTPPGSLGRRPAHQRGRGNIRQVRGGGQGREAQKTSTLQSEQGGGSPSGRLPRRGGRGSDRERGRRGQVIPLPIVRPGPDLGQRECWAWLGKLNTVCLIAWQPGWAALGGQVV